MSTPDIALTHAAVGELHIKAIAERLGVGLRDIASAGGIGLSTLHNIVARNQWPHRKIVRRTQMLDLLRERGASDEELLHAFDIAPDINPLAPHLAGRTSKTKAALAENHPEIDMLMGKQTLTMTARKAFGLFANPFDGEVQSEEEMFVSGEIRFIREACKATAYNGSFVAVMGESGAGKTTIVADLKDHVANSTKPIIMIEPSVLGMTSSDRVGKMLKAGDILAAGVSSLLPNTPIKQTIESRTRQFVKALEDSVLAGNNHMLVIEEAHDLPVSTLQHLKRLHERTRIGRKSGLGILLVGHPELMDKLRKVREVFQRCEALELRPLDNDLQPYLAHKAKQAGKNLDELITADGVAEIRTRLTFERKGLTSQGVRQISLAYPLVVNNVMIAALNLAAELGAPVIDKDIVRAVR